MQYPTDYYAWLKTDRSPSLMRRAKKKAKGMLSACVGDRTFDFTRSSRLMLRALGAFGGKTVLDVGAGSGGLLDLLRPLGFVTTGLEPSAEACDHMKQAGHGVLDWKALSGGGHTFDLITLHHVFEHLDSPVERLQVLAGCLNPGGVS